LANARRTNLHLHAFDFQGVTVDLTRDSHFVTYVILNFGLVANTDLRIKPDWSKLDDAELAAFHRAHSRTVVRAERTESFAVLRH